MKYLSLPTFDTITGALNFDTPDCHVAGGCDLYTTKAAGSDKKLYKNIQQSLESQHAALIKFGATLSPPQRETMAFSMNLSRDSPFGSLDEISNRRTFAYLIATLNASHPDYDFSNVLRPADFQSERNLRRVMNHIDGVLNSVRPSSVLLDAPTPHYSPSTASSSAAPAWGPQMWAMIDEEMSLKDCSVFSYQPAEDPFADDDGAIWSLHYFFFNKTLKRVTYLYARGLPVMSHSPRLRPHLRAPGSSLKRRALENMGASKRARYWLGDAYAEAIETSGDDMADDGFVWNRDADGDMECNLDDMGESFEDEESDQDEDADDSDDQGHKCAMACSSEDIAATLEVEA